MLRRHVFGMFAIVGLAVLLSVATPVSSSAENVSRGVAAPPAVTEFSPADSLSCDSGEYCFYMNISFSSCRTTTIGSISNYQNATMYNLIPGNPCLGNANDVTSSARNNGTQDPRGYHWVCSYEHAGYSGQVLWQFYLGESYANVGSAANDRASSHVWRNNNSC